MRLLTDAECDKAAAFFARSIRCLPIELRARSLDVALTYAGTRADRAALLAAIYRHSRLASAQRMRA
jgi:hypothetical protein